MYRALERQKWLPDGTTEQNWKTKTVADWGLDAAPLPGDPDFQKKTVALILQTAFFDAGSAVKPPTAVLTNGSKTLEDLAQWLFDNQVGG
jgi:hypothetical protein